MTAYKFHADLIDQSIRDNPLADRGLLCERETRNLHDLQAVAIKKMIDGTWQVVGCVRTKISSISSIFLKQVAVLHSRETFL